MDLVDAYDSDGGEDEERPPAFSRPVVNCAPDVCVAGLSVVPLEGQSLVVASAVTASTSANMASVMPALRADL